MKNLPIGPTELGLLANMMRKVEFFTPLTVGQLEQILPSIMLYAYEAGETVFSQGQKGDAFYIIYKGSVEVSLKRWLILSTKLATLREGEFVGEIALISDAPRTATVKAAEPTMLFTLVADDFKLVLDQNPAAAAEMARIARQRSFATSHNASS